MHTSKEPAPSEHDQQFNLAVRQNVADWFLHYTGPPPAITLTGIDERTDLARAAKLNAELGILLSLTPEGRPRYPSQEWIFNKALEVLPNVAIHICGSAARNGLATGILDDIALHPAVKRIQLNGHYTIADVGYVCDYFQEKQIITQQKDGNDHLQWVERANHQILMDSSGGKGLCPTNWDIPWRRAPVSQPIVELARIKRVGFAGGLGPDNLYEQLGFMVASNRNACLGWWWVDMENKLRDSDDWFSLDAAEDVVLQFEKFLNYYTPARADAKA